MSGNKIAVLADVHSNFSALEAVLQHAHHNGVEQLWFLGDAVGYGPEPHRCLYTLINNVAGQAWVQGNHDRALSLLDPSAEWDGDKPYQSDSLHPLREEIGSNKSALIALKRNQEILECIPERAGFLLSRPLHQRVGKRVLLIHGGLRDNTPTTTYTKYEWHARDEFLSISRKFKTPAPHLCFVGHTHRPTVFRRSDSAGWEVFEKVEWKTGQPIVLDNDQWLINPGSVGQPRDLDWRACYAVYDSSDLTVEFHRVEYELKRTQRRMSEFGFPETLIRRLEVGR